ncbi:MAG: type II secretion system protein GspG [Planctomycetaceae bacterium]|jgi:hypothetical protein|nr:type II secretion system protein GspG [Planctomycetaceae bacterium]
MKNRLDVKFVCRINGCWWWIFAAGLLVYFCLIPSSLRISPETTGLTAFPPLLPDGTPDYFAAWSEATWLPNIAPPEDNGARLMLAACGPRILEQNALMNEVPWEELPAHEKSKFFFGTYWKPMCEAMGIDPLAKPKFLDKIAITSRVNRKQKELKGKPEEKEWTHEIFDQRYKKTAWKTVEHPEVAAWLADYSPVLDLLGVAARKPHYEGWRKRENSLIQIQLPDVQASRDFARSLEFRIAARIGDGDIDGAVYDLLTMFHLARHFLRSDIFVTKLVGNSIEEMAYHSALLLLQSGTATREQLARLAESVQKLPSRWDAAVMTSLLEELTPYDTLSYLYKQGITKRWNLAFGEFPSCSEFRVPFYAALPLDMNTAGKRLTELLQTDLASEWRTSPATWRSYTDAADERIRLMSGEFRVRHLALPLIYVRSQMVAELLYCRLAPAWQYCTLILLDGGTKTELLRLALQLELYKADNVKYPETLAALVPKYMEDVPLDPFTGRQTLQYKPEHDGYILYSFGQNGKDDGGEPMTKNAKNTGDIVIKRNL